MAGSRPASHCGVGESFAADMPTRSQCAAIMHLHADMTMPDRSLDVACPQCNACARGERRTAEHAAWPGEHVPTEFAVPQPAARP